MNSVIDFSVRNDVKVQNKIIEVSGHLRSNT